MRNLAKKEGNQVVHALLKDRDPESCSAFHPNDHKRVVRALEYFRSTDTPYPEAKEKRTPRMTL